MGKHPAAVGSAFFGTAGIGSGGAGCYAAIANTVGTSSCSPSAWRGGAFDCPKLNASYLEHWVGQTQRVLPGGSRERFLMPPQSLVYLFDPNARGPVG